jgi:hypothetical protein
MKLIQQMNIQKYYQRCDFRESGSFVAEDKVFAWCALSTGKNLIATVNNNRHTNISEDLYLYLCLF